MQPGYSNPPLPPQNPMQPPQPQANPYAAPSPQPYPPPAQPVMHDIAPPQSYGYNQPQQQPQPAPAPQPPRPAQPVYNSHLPANTVQPPVTPRPMNDIAPPNPSPFSPLAPPTQQPLNQGQFSQPSYQPVPQAPRPQLVQDIPIRAPATSNTSPPSQPYAPPQPPPANPFNHPSQPAPFNQNLADNHMEDILKDVNRNVARPASQAHKRSPLPNILSKLKLNKLKVHTTKAVTQPKPVMVVSLAAVAFLSLAMAAFFAFSGSDSKAGPSGPEIKVVGTTAVAGDSIQANGGLLVSPQEIEDLSNALKNEIGDLNESQDFNQEPLTDQALGL